MENLTLENLHRELLKDFPIDYENQSELVILDLVTVMGSVYCLDVTITKRSTELVIDIPVFNKNLWDVLKVQLEQLLYWVSEERFKVSFKEMKIEDLVLPPQLTFSLDSVNNRVVTLFSGGLDSLTGAYFNFKHDIESDYLGFINKNEEATKQRFLKNFYMGKMSPVPIVKLIEKPVEKKNHYTQATRSLLYFSLAIANAFYNKSKTVYLYENGVLSLNPKLFGRFTTKTTHPKTIYEFNRILEILDLDIKIEHPFLFKTKAEAITDMDGDFKNVIKESFTCGASRSSSLRNHTGQCGVCIPCLLRKISMAAYDHEQYDCQYYIGYELENFHHSIYEQEYVSNLYYFETYSKLIKENRIWPELKLRDRYFEQTDYLIRIMEMLNKFTYEYERYKEKYGAYRHSRSY